ncbi:Nop14 domain containing protein [Pyrenophora teres f. maculata]|nr:Nop14 domain containing protein [Pyrenophora teres f. maculata]
MVRQRSTRNAPLKEPRIDSGAAMSSDTVVPGSSSSSRTLEMPMLLHTDWECEAPNVRYRKDELQLKQPKGFPIILMPSTLERARKEAEAGAGVVRHTGPYFEIYEDEEDEDVGSGGDDIDAEGEDDIDAEGEDDIDAEGEDDIDAEGEDEYEVGDEENNEHEYEDENNYNDKNDYLDQTCTAKPISAPVARKPLAVVDCLGRTRAAAKSLKVAVESKQPADAQNTPDVCDNEDKAAGNKKRKRGVTQASKKPKKTHIREQELAGPELGRIKWETRGFFV